MELKFENQIGFFQKNDPKMMTTILNRKGIFIEMGESEANCHTAVDVIELGQAPLDAQEWNEPICVCVCKSSGQS